MQTECPDAPFRLQITITPDVIDHNGHVNNVAYLQWMQDVAVGHAQAVVRDDIYEELGCTWVARTHHIEYLAPAFAGEPFEIRTWLADIRRVRCQRKYEFVRLSDNKLLVRAETDWVFVRASDGAPRSIPDEIRHAF